MINDDASYSLGTCSSRLGDCRSCPHRAPSAAKENLPKLVRGMLSHTPQLLGWGRQAAGSQRWCPRPLLDG